MTRTDQYAAARAELARRIRAARKASAKNGRAQLRREANDCRLGKRSYSRTFGIGKAPKVCVYNPDWGYSAAHA